jgi:hypothetical protein
MPAIELTEEQRRRLETVRADVEDAFVDTYGHTELGDAIDYLLDTYTPPAAADGQTDMEVIATADYTALQHVATDVDGVPGSGIGADEMRGQLLAELGAEALAARLNESDTDEDATAGATASDSIPEDATTATDEDDGEPAGEARETADESDVDDEADDDGVGDDGDSEDGDQDVDSDDADDGGVTVGPGGGDVLSAANRLLDANDDKWREGGGDTPYEVDLPDGTTEGVRTKDDVRQLLFRHYA